MTDSRYKGTTYDVEREKDMMLWLEGKLPVPKVLHFERHDGWSNLLMSEADGVLCSEEYEDEQSPEKIIELYAECIRLFHSIDISDCPYTNSLDSRLAELDYLLNNDRPMWIAKTGKKTLHLKIRASCMIFKDGKARRGTCLFPRRPGRQQHLCERWQSKWLY